MPNRPTCFLNVLSCYLINVIIHYYNIRSLNNAKLLSLMRQNVHDVIAHGFMILNTTAVMFHLLIFNTLIIGYDSI